MKTKLILTAILIMLLTGCQFMPNILPVVYTLIPESSGTPVTIEVETQAASPSPVQISTPSLLPLPTVTPTMLPIVLQTGSPAYIQNFAHPDAGCAWLGVAGQIFDAENKPVTNLAVIVKGMLGQAKIDKIALTGIPEADVYGPGGYEIILADQPLVSNNTLSIQVFDIDGNSLSKSIPFITYSDCEKNLIIINFLIN